MTTPGHQAGPTPADGGLVPGTGFPPGEGVPEAGEAGYGFPETGDLRYGRPEAADPRYGLPEAPTRRYGRTGADDSRYGPSGSGSGPGPGPDPGSAPEPRAAGSGARDTVADEHDWGDDRGEADNVVTGGPASGHPPAHDAAEETDDYAWAPGRADPR